MISTAQKMKLAFTLLQALTVLAGALGTFVGGCYLGGGIAFLCRGDHGLQAFERFAVLIGCIALAAAGACCYRALYLFFRMCGRLKTQRAFISENSTALRSISRMLLISGICCAVLLFPLLAMSLFTFYTVFVLSVLVFLFVGVSLAVKVLQMLLLRAMTLQDESDWTV